MTILILITALGMGSLWRFWPFHRWQNKETNVVVQTQWKFFTIKMKSALLDKTLSVSFICRMQHRASLRPPDSQQARALCHAVLPSLRHRATRAAEFPSSICAPSRAPYLLLRRPPRPAPLPAILRSDRQRNFRTCVNNTDEWLVMWSAQAFFKDCDR